MLLDRIKALTVDEIQKYIASGVSILPVVQDAYLTQLGLLQYNHRVCLLPITVLEMYNINLKKRLLYKAQQCKRQEQHRKVG